MTGLDFSPNGEIIATSDFSGTCLISDINTGSYRFHLDIDPINWGKIKNFENTFKSSFPPTMPEIFCSSDIRFYSRLQKLLSSENSR